MKKKILSLGLLVLALSACSSWFDSNQPYLQSNTNLIAGERVVANEKTTAYAIAKKYNVQMNDVIVLNRLPSPYVIWPGQEIALPSNAQSTRRTGNLPANNNYHANNYIPTQKQSSAVAVSELPPPVYQSPAYRAEPLANQIRNDPQQALAPSLSDVRFVWPVEGPILAGFGPRNSGGKNDGLNIAAPRGAPVVAAANGVVLHAGNDTKGYGNLVLIRHGDGYITAYAHLDRMIVDKDSVIAKGDMIGMVGSTGDVKGPQLHFEVRYNGKPVDPTPQLPPHSDPSPY